MSEVTGAPLSLLLVDPRAGNAAVVRGMLEAAGHLVTFVHDWPSAELRLSLHPYAAVVMCVTTPGPRRRTAAAALRAPGGRHAGLPLLGLDPGVDHIARQRALSEGFDAVVSRPFGAEALEAALRQAIRERAPPLLLDADRRAALRGEHGPAALAALDQAAMALAARLLPPIMEHGGTPEQILAAAEALAEAMAGIGAIHAAAQAEAMGRDAARGRRAVHPLAGALAATRTMLRHDRLTAARHDPIWAASDTQSGDTP